MLDWRHTNIKKFLICLAAYLLTAAPDGFATEIDNWQPTRKALDGCSWKPFSYEQQGIKLWYQVCQNPSAHYVLSWKGNALQQHRPADDRTFNGPTIIELYEKPAGRPIEQMIADLFIGKLAEIERDNCYVTKEKTPPAQSGIERYRIVPTFSYEKKIVDAFNKDTPEGGVPYDTICGEHGKWSEGNAYFEYHPAKSATKFLYVITGQDEPLFDENSIRIIK